MGLHESATLRISAPAEAVFRLVSDPTKLPEWNHAITEVVEAPDHLASGSVWKVKIHAFGQSWVSRSQVSTLNSATGRFAYRSQSDDGNPSYADWEWHIEPDQDGSKVTVSVDLNPVTFWRKYLLVRIRRPALRKEMQDSLEALGAAIQS
jgi:uncharacterized protein YndB with AHSA1/START domain